MNTPSPSNLPGQPKPAPDSAVSDIKGVLLFLWNFSKGLLGLGLALWGLFITLFCFLALNQVSFLGATFVDLFLKWLCFGLLPLWGGVRLLKGLFTRANQTTAISNEKKRRWRPNLVTVLLALFVFGPAITSLIQSTNFHDPFRKDHLLVAEDSQLGATEITSVLAAPIRPGTNLLWCGSFQLAWNAACSLMGEDLHFTQEPPLVAALNQKPFTRADLDEASYVALAGFTQNGIHRQIEQAVRDKFQGWVQPRFIPDPKLTPRPQDMVAYACLFKDLQFPVPFERIKRPVPFGNTNVACFGFEGNNPKHEAMYPQVLVLDYQSHEDFVIELKSKATGDRLLLAKVQPQTSIAATIAAVKVRAAGTNTQPAKARDVLVVPKLNFDLTRTFREIQGKRLVVKNPKIARDLVLQSAVQNTRFQMDEKGVTVRSESHLTLACAAPPRPQHVMVFDRPFLIMMERDGAKSPYLALWVDNPELLVPW